MRAAAQPRALREHREEERDALRIDTVDRAPRQPEARRRHERLDLDEQRPRPFDRRDDDAAGDAAAPLFEEDLGRVHDLAKAALPHLEHADLVGRAEPVLRAAQHAERVEALALEIEDRVDDVLEHAWPSDRAFLCHVTDEEDRHVIALRDLEQPRRALAQLRHATGGGADHVR